MRKTLERPSLAVFTLSLPAWPEFSRVYWFRMLPLWVAIVLPGLSDLLLLCFPFQKFRFLAVSGTSQVPVRAFVARVISIILVCCRHHVAPFIISCGPWLKPAGRSFPAVSCDQIQKGVFPWRGCVTSPLVVPVGFEPTYLGL